MPAWSLLAELPWGTIVKQAAVLLKAANQLRAHSEQPVVTKGASDIDALRQRVAELEEHQRANAQLLQQLADETAALAVAAQATAVRAKQAFVLAIVGVGVGVAAMVLAWLR